MATQGRKTTTAVKARKKGGSAQSGRTKPVNKAAARPASKPLPASEIPVKTQQAKQKTALEEEHRQEFRLEGCQHYDFFQAVRLIQAAYPERAGVGRDSAPDNEVLRFKSKPSLSFPASAVAEVETKPDELSQMTVAFMGLTGPLGVLPRHYTEEIIQRNRHKDRAMADFLDMFNHRLISLFYRAWEKHRLEVSFEKGDKDDHFAFYLLCLLGLGTDGLRNRLGVADQALLYYTGVLAQRPRSAEVLKGTLESIFNVPVSVRQFQGQWLALDDSTRSSLGARNNRLGIDTVVGERVWDKQVKFVIEIGPVRLATFRDYLRPGKEFGPLTNLVRTFVGDEYDFGLNLIIDKNEAPLCQLGADDENAPLLGWTSWLLTPRQPGQAAGWAELHLDDVTIDVT